MPGLSDFLNLMSIPMVGEVAKIVSLVLLVAVIALGARVAGAEARLAHVRRQTSEVFAEREHALAELAASRDKIAQLDRKLAEQGECLRASQASADKRVAEAQQAAELAQATAAARDAHLKALQEADPRSLESRFEAANRLITDALKSQKT